MLAKRRFVRPPAYQIHSGGGGATMVDQTYAIKEEEEKGGEGRGGMAQKSF